jgi:hypothetical protein
MFEYAVQVKDRAGDKQNVLSYADDQATVINILIRERWISEIVSVRPTGNIDLCETPHWKHVSIR